MLEFWSLKAFILLVIAAICSTTGNILLKFSKTANLSFMPHWLAELKPLFFAAVVFYLLNLIAFSKSLEVLPVSVSYPVLAALGFVMLTITSSILLHESLTWLQLAGLCVIILGIAMLTTSPLIFEK